MFLLCVLYVVCCVVMCLCLWLFLFILAEFVVYLVLLLYYFVFSEYKEKQRNTTQKQTHFVCLMFLLFVVAFLCSNCFLFSYCFFYVGECEDIASNTEDTNHKANNNQ
jgi:heme/copper-type cytochrome/quinol oxidase subunit 2